MNCLYILMGLVAFSIQVQAEIRSENFNEINDYLMKNLDSDNPEANIAKASEWLESLPRTSTRPQGDLREALEVFIALRDVVGTKCDERSFDILMKNDQASDNRAHGRASTLGPLRRIDVVIYHYGLKHLINCRPLYPTILKSKLDNMDQVERLGAERIADAVIKVHTERAKLTSDLRGQRGIELIMGIQSVKSPQDMQALFNVASSLSGQKATSARSISKRQLEALVKPNLIEPCDYYVRQLTDVFTPASYDVIMLDREERYTYPDPNYYDSWARFRICNMIIAWESIVDDIQVALK